MKIDPKKLRGLLESRCYENGEPIPSDLMESFCFNSAMMLLDEVDRLRKAQKEVRALLIALVNTEALHDES